MGLTVNGALPRPPVGHQTVAMDYTLDPVFTKDMAGVLERQSFTGAVGSNKNGTLVVMNNSDIPVVPSRLRDAGKSTVVKLTVISCKSAGFSKVPYTSPLPGMPPVQHKNQQELQQKITEDGIEKLKMWSFEKCENNSDKGRRDQDENHWLVEPGNTITMFVNYRNFQSKNPDEWIFPSRGPTDPEVIPAFSLLEINVASRNMDAIGKIVDPSGEEGKGSALRISKINFVNCSLYSYSKHLRSFSTSLSQARETQQKVISRFPMLKNDINTYETPFFVPCVKRDPFTNDEGEMLRICNWDSNQSECIDIEPQLAMKYTNTASVSAAAALIDIAICSGALQVLVFTNDYWGKKEGSSIYRGVPMVNTKILLELVSKVKEDKVISEYDADSNEITIHTGKWFNMGDDTSKEVVIRICVNPEKLTGGQMHIDDFPILSAVHSCEKAYPIWFDLDAEDECEVVRGNFIGYLNGTTVKTIMGGVSYSRKRPVSMNEEVAQKKQRV